MLPVHLIKRFLAAGAVLLCLFTWGCAGEEYNYVDDGDLKPGPGLFSGEDGVFTLYGKTAPEQAEESTETNKQNKTMPKQ